MTADIKDIYAAYIASWSSHDPEKVASFFTDDCVFEDMAFNVTMRGKEELKQFVATTFAAYPDFAMEMTFGFGAGDVFASEWVMTGTHTGDLYGAPATRRRFSVRGASITRFEDGKMKHHTDYWSLSLLLEQLNLPHGGTP